MSLGPEYGDCPCCSFGLLRRKNPTTIKCDRCDYSRGTRDAWYDQAERKLQAERREIANRQNGRFTR